MRTWPSKGKVFALVAVGDPTVADNAVVSSRQIRVEGRRIGVTDLSIVTPDGQPYSFEVRVVADLHVLRGQLHCLFPDATIKLTQIRDHVAVEGEARDAAQVARIIETVQAYLTTQYEKHLPTVRALLRLDAAHVRGPFGHCD